MVAAIHHDQETRKPLCAKFVIRIKCEIYPNCPRYIPNLNTKKPSIYVPRILLRAPPAPEWKEEIILKIFYLKATLIKVEINWSYRIV